MQKIFDGMDRARELGFADYGAFVREWSEKAGHPWLGEVAKQKVNARVDYGRWLCDCPCGGAMLVCPDEPVMFCPNCGNDFISGAALTVVFPADKVDIEQELLQRPVTEPRLPHGTQAALNARPSLPGLARSWDVGESVNDLLTQRNNAAARGKDNGR